MKKMVMALILLGFILTPLVYAEDITWTSWAEKGVTVYPLGNNEALLLIRTQEEAETHWFLIKEYNNKKLGTNLSSMIDVADIQSSPENKYLAVISVGEGHPILEVVDLRKLLEQKEYHVLHETNPYPGTVNIEQWEGPNLIISSDIQLTLKPEERDLLPEPQSFIINIATGTITARNQGNRRGIPPWLP